MPLSNCELQSRSPDSRAAFFPADWICSQV